jgi:hypothetical protein
VEVQRSPEGVWVDAPGYRLVVAPEDGRRVRLEVPPGRPLADLVLISSAHPPRAVDELSELGRIEVREAEGGAIVVSQDARSTVWESKRAELECRPDGLVYRATFRGSAPIDELHLFESGDRDTSYLNRPTLSGFWRPPRARGGWAASRGYFPRVFSPAPNGAGRTHFWSGERATNHPANEAPFWGGDWFFTPAPFAYALGGDGRWLVAGLAARQEELSFVHFDYRGGETWGLALTYQGRTRADGVWESPRVLLLPAADEYAGLAAYRDWLEADDLLPASSSTAEAWWREPIWCGWGEQVAREGCERAAALSTRRNYERWLAILDRHAISPGTVVIDDRWQARLGHPEPSRRWNGLGGFIAGQHAAGRRVLLWHNVWEVEAPDPDDALVTRDGRPAIGAFGYPMVDPTAPGFVERLRRVMTRLLAPPPTGFGADGLKLDITHSTPEGSGYRLAADEATGSPASWGNALLYHVLRETYRAAKEVRPDALVESHAVNPLFRDTCDVIRLNDVFSDRASVVEEMRHRGQVARAAGFSLIDTDCWTMPTRAALIEYVEAQPALGIPSL